MNKCPFCNSPVIMKTDALSFSYKEQTYLHTATGAYCKNCDELFFEPEELDKSTQCFEDFKRQIKEFENVL